MNVDPAPLARHVLTILAVENVARAAAFYRQAFGFRQTVDVPVYAELAMPSGMRLGLYEREGFGRNTGQVPLRAALGELHAAELYFQTDDLAALVDALGAAGARELSARRLRDWGDEVAYFADPDGHVIAIASAPTT